MVALDTGLSRLSQENVRHSVFEQLRDKITGKAWPPGSKMPSENVLASSLGVSRVSVREALRMLASLGLVEIKRGEGSFVRAYSGEVLMNPLLPMLALDELSVLDVLEYRMIVEKGTILMVVERAGVKEIAEIESAYSRMRASSGDPEAFARADLDFHLALARGTGNPIVIKVNEIIRSALSQSMEAVIRALGPDDGLLYHGKMIEAIKRRNRAEAGALMEEHIKRTIVGMSGKMRRENAS
jgi:GntR family transcriptional regulator, transcriptional repressor for pyruvate dehydrogenase complex